MSRSRQRKLTNRKREYSAAFETFGGGSSRGRCVHYDLSDRTRGLDTGGIGAMHRLARHTGLIDEIDRRVEVPKAHLPYHESDHVLGIAYNILCGGTCLQDIELRRQNEVYLDALGAQRRFSENRVLRVPSVHPRVVPHAGSDEIGRPEILRGEQGRPELLPALVDVMGPPW